MPKSPQGRFPIPKVAGRSSNSRKADTGRSYPGTSGTKSPTGSRPVPQVASGPKAKVPGGQGGGRVPVKPTPMAGGRNTSSTAHRNRRGR